MWSLMYSNCLVIYQLMLHGSTIKVYFMCSSVYQYTINNDYTWYCICSAWFLDIIISTCFVLDKLSDSASLVILVQLLIGYRK